jgi:exportin-7
LANKGPSLQDFVVTALIKLVCRITKLGWFDDPVHRELADDVTKFLQATVDHCILGLKILNQLVDELNIPTSGRTLTQHRKTSVSFRDVCLLKVFQLGLTTLKQLQTRTISKYSLFDSRLLLIQQKQCSNFPSPFRLPQLPIRSRN